MKLQRSVNNLCS